MTMWIATLSLAATLGLGRVSIDADQMPLPEAMKIVAGQLGSRLELDGDFSDLLLTLRLQNEPAHSAVRRMLEGWPVDYYLRGLGEVIILRRRDRSGGPSVVMQSPAPELAATPSAYDSAPVRNETGTARSDTVEKEVERAVEFIGRFGELTPEEKKRLRQELIRNW